ncbi:EAL domain-containing protein [Ferruginivarius sediminum]|nr:EAL domain-containing protein [Ferruginivarius sediminum]
MERDSSGTPFNAAGDKPNAPPISVSTESPFSWADLLLVANASGRITAAHGNWRGFTGHGTEDLAGLWLRDVMDGTAVEELLTTPRNGVRRAPVCVRLIAENGNQLEARAAAVAVAPLDGTCIGIRMTPTQSSQEPREMSSGASSRAGLARSAARGIATGTSALSILGFSAPSEFAAGAVSDWTWQTCLQALDGRIRGQFAGCGSVTRLNDNLYAIEHDPHCDVTAMCDEIEGVGKHYDDSAPSWNAVCAGVNDCVPPGTEQDELTKALICSLARLGEVSSFSTTDFQGNIARLLQESIADVRGFEQMLDGKGFGVVYHPVLNARSGLPLYVEALCRFHADSGASPFRRLAFAEQTGLVHLFDAAMVRHILSRMAEAGGSAAASSIAINISAASLENTSFAGLLHEVLQASSVPPERVVFEITQAERIADIDKASAFVHDLRHRGHRVCLDDLSAGSVSFEYLSRIDVDYVKLDGGAVSRARNAAKGRAFLSALTDLCRRIGTQTIAEMIDERETLEFVRECGVSYVQGFLFGKPTEHLQQAASMPATGYFATRGQDQPLP